MNRTIGLLLVGLASLAFASPASSAITRVWLSHRTHEPSKLVVNWETAQPGDSVVRYAARGERLATIRIDESVTLHHVEIPLQHKNTVYRYFVTTGEERSAEATFKAYPTDTLRVAIVADWAGKPKLDALAKDDVHLLLSAGDNIGSLHQRCGAGVKDCTKPYSELIDAYPQIFRSTPFLPALGNHDREIRPRGDRPPAEPVYDVDATAFRKFFELPDSEWKWYFDVPDFKLRLMALDLNHTSDVGTTWQTCHPFDALSEQFHWYDSLLHWEHPPRLVTIYNERNATVRSLAGGAWQKLLKQGSLVVSGFGYFAERAEVDDLPYYNTALGIGAKYPDPKSKFFESVPSYLLMTFTADEATVELKGLDGRVLDTRQGLGP